MKPRVGFVVEQALGHVAYGQSLRRALANRNDLEIVWLEIPYDFEGLGKIPLVGRNWTLRGSARAFRAIQQAHTATPLDALFIHTQTISIFSGRHMSRIPTLLSLDATPKNYDELAHAYGDVIDADTVEFLKLSVHRKVMRNAERFTVWSNWARDSLIRDYQVRPERIFVSYPGTVLANFPAPGQRTPRSGRPLRVLFVGGDFVRKGGDLLKEVCTTGSLAGKVELHLVTGADVPQSEFVRVYRGVKPHAPELLRLYAEADVFALPTRGDCLAVVLGEAMASSLPIITTQVGAHAEAVEHGKSGFVIQQDDAKALRESLEQLEQDPELTLSMGRRSREIGEERFDMHKNANRIADVLIELALSGRKQR